MSANSFSSYYDVNGNAVRAIFVDYVLQLETGTSIAKVFIA
jgi:hypothetical protein